MAKRLDGIYGRVDERMNARISTWVTGPRVLDVGCGFGQLVDFLRRKGFKAVGTDFLRQCIDEGRCRFPKADLHVADSDLLQFADQSFDTIVLKDTFHHINSEGDIVRCLNEVKCVCRKRLIVMDPNPTAILLLSRRLIKHNDPVCSPDEAKEILTAAGIRTTYIEFNEVIAFPLSGGFVGHALVPNKIIGSTVLIIDSLLCKVLNLVRMERYFCWRYLLVADLR